VRRVVVMGWDGRVEGMLPRIPARGAGDKKNDCLIARALTHASGRASLISVAGLSLWWGFVPAITSEAGRMVGLVL
jgi:hypothetical protein